MVKCFEKGYVRTTTDVVGELRSWLLFVPLKGGVGKPEAKS